MLRNEKPGRKREMLSMSATGKNLGESSYVSDLRTCGQGRLKNEEKVGDIWLKEEEVALDIRGMIRALSCNTGTVKKPGEMSYATKLGSRGEAL